MFKHWAFDSTRNRYTGTHGVCDTLPSGLFTFRLTPYGEPVAEQLELRKDEICRFTTGPMCSVMAEISAFWKNKDRYRTFGMSHKRGILLYGPSGCGKTGIISAVIEDTVARKGMVCRIEEVETFSRVVPLLRQIERDRPIVTVLEDVERMLYYHEEDLLELMDGASAICDSILFVATTNRLEKIPARIRARPSRIDTLMEVGYPSGPQRQEYLEFILPKFVEPPKVKSLCKAFLPKTEKYSLAMLKELVLSTQVYGQPLDVALSRMNVLREVKNDDDD